MTASLRDGPDGVASAGSSRAAPRDERGPARHTTVVATRLALIVIVLVAWQFGPRSVHDLVGDPYVAVLKLGVWIGDGTLVQASGKTLLGAVLGLLVGTLAAVVWAATTAVAASIDRAQQPLVRFLYALPKIALLPLFVLWFGVGLAQHVAITAVTVFFFMFYAVRMGVRSMPRPLLDMMRILGAPRHVLVRVLYLPAGVQWLLSGLRIALPYSLVATVSAELLSGTTGLGALMSQSSRLLDPAGVVAGIFATAILSIILLFLYRELVRSVSWATSSSDPGTPE